MLMSKTSRNYDNTPLQLALEQLSSKHYEIAPTQYRSVLPLQCIDALCLDYDAIRLETGLQLSKERLEVVELAELVHERPAQHRLVLLQVALVHH